MIFKKNLHLSKRCRLKRILRDIEYYPKQYPTPKYLIFIKQMLESGWYVRIYKVRASKYVFVSKGNDIFKIRFSNHKPIYEKEIENDCDYYVGISHKQVSTTEEIINKITKI